MKASWKHLGLAGLGLALPIAATTSQGLQKRNWTTGPLVDDQALQDAVTIDGLLAHAQALEDIAYATPGRNRVVASAGHNNTVKYIVDQLEALGGFYHVELQPFNTTLQLDGNATFIVNGVNYTASPLEWSSSVSLTDLPVVPVAAQGCFAADFPVNVSGAIALVSRGGCYFADKAYHAKAAGAVGAVIYNNVADALVSGTFGGQNDTLAPAAGITQEDGLALVAAAGNGTNLVGSLDVATEIGTIYSNNVIATTTFQTNTTDILFLGAHSDSVAAGPGINDNGSGSSGILEVAIQLARGRYRTIPTVKFGWWTAEEQGLLGAAAYVAEHAGAEELARIRLYLNFDMIASPNYLLGVYDGDSSAFPDADPGPPGSAETEATLAAWFEAQGLNHTEAEFSGRSDYGPFLDAGIPSGGLDTGADEVKTEEEAEEFGGTAGVVADPNYHTAADNVANLSLEAFGIMGKGIAHALAYYGAGGFEGYPQRGAAALTRRKSAEDRPVGARRQTRPLRCRGHKRAV